MAATVGLLSLAWADNLTEIEISVPVMVTYSGDPVTARWNAKGDPATFPELNAGDKVKFLRAESVNLQLGTWARTYRRFSHRSCSGTLFWRKCREEYAHDEFTKIKRFEPLSDAVELRLEFVNRYDPSRPWNKGKYRLKDYVGREIGLAGPLEARVEGGVETPVPSTMDGAAGTPEGPVRAKYIAGRDGPVQWVTLIFKVTVAQSIR